MKPNARQKAPLVTQPGSLTDSILRLPVGGEHAVVRFLDPANDDLSEAGISTIKTRLNSQVSGAVVRLRSATDAQFSVEGAVFSTTRNRLYAAIIVTRTA